MSSHQKHGAVSDFEQLLNTSLQNFINASEAIGGPLVSLAGKVKGAFLKNLELIQFGLRNAQPPMDSERMKAYANGIREIVETREGPKDSSFSNHFATVREAILALGWINVKPAPTQYIKDAREAGEYYANRVLSNNKGNQLHRNWVTSWNQLLTDLQKYVAANFLTGFPWGSGEARGAAFPPPPPPPPSAFLPDISTQGDGGRQALLNELNQGSSITQHLKPVKRDRNGPTPHAPPVVQGKVPAAKLEVTRPPKLHLEGRKWVVEYQKNQHELRIENNDMSQSLAMFKCENVSLQVVNKMNNVIHVKAHLLLLNGIISSVELIRCNRVEVRLSGIVPLINMDNCDSVQVFVTNASRSVELITSKSTSCNVCLLKDDGEYKELACARADQNNCCW
ncbi:adenylyl cyclase-associated protein [Trichonephila inaurata madagascariensis]|uniref:Adenylyl cyclase-associated protein n=1 Tax=Trichonephila inaurata madagascariensis TaxID=2747483 RepID=A0A8X6XB41_9ARAC|nr:adenylyl cyclase-associated protein [Trichonephila inaurata madagascariensis]